MSFNVVQHGYLLRLKCAQFNFGVDVRKEEISGRGGQERQKDGIGTRCTGREEPKKESAGCFAISLDFGVDAPAREDYGNRW